MKHSDIAHSYSGRLTFELILIIQALLQEPASGGEDTNFTFRQFDALPFPLDPSVRITGVVSEKSTLFKSSLMPAKITFNTEDGEEYVAIFKIGDDLRQDQLILQVGIFFLAYVLCRM